MQQAFAMQGKMTNTKPIEFFVKKFLQMSFDIGNCNKQA